ncbi:MAG: LPXTG cell wall anchor domain-containing protein [Candidatus Nanopelagicales bacterium]
MKRSSSFSVSRRGVLAASTVGALGVAVVAVPMLAISASATPSSGSDDHKVTICHRDNDEKKPYVKETVDIASTGLLKSGHNGHTGDVFAPGMKADHDKWGDIIPPYTYKTFTFAGLNWDADGQAIYKAGCKVVVATPTETESEDPSPQESTPATDPSAEESSPATDPSPVESSPATDPSAEESSPATDPSPVESSPATDPSAEESSPATDPSPVESSPATDPSAEESSPATDPSPVESSPATDPSPVESSPATDPSPEDSSNGGPQGSGSPSPEESSSTPVDPATPSDTTTDPGLPSTGGTGTTLPKTGSDTAALLGLAAGLVTMGAASIVVARRRTEVETD